MDPIAIVGLACRFPGAPNAEQFWRLLRAGERGIVTPDAASPQSTDAAAANDPSHVAATTVIDGHDRFDAAFFGVTPREAEILDPQHRLFLECAWHGLEDAAVDPARFPGRIGVFAGTGLSSYLLRNLLPDDRLRNTVGVHPLLIANDRDFLATRVSHKLDLRGPSLTVSTACSTSLAAVHLACQSLQAWECDLAIAGGVRIQVPHGRGYHHAAGGILSADGHCRAFAADADGTVPGDGVGVVVLARQEDAEATRLPTRAWIRGWAMNNDGAAKVGFAAPSTDGQARVVQEALEVAEVAPASVGYVEAHGTGTPLGDPIEIAALRRVFDRSAGDVPDGDVQRLLVGSVKSSIGHLDAAAGVASLIKTVLALERGMVPPSLDCAETSPRLGLANSRLDVVKTSTPWPEIGGPRRAGVSAFGMGGTNVHVVLEEAPGKDASPKEDVARPADLQAERTEPRLLVLSARTPGALARTAHRLSEHLSDTPTSDLAEVATTLALGRQAFEHRQAVVAEHVDDAVVALAALAAPPKREGADRAPLEGTPSVIFLFPGQGAQQTGMASDLYGHEPSFRRLIDQAAERLKPKLGTDLRARLFPADGGHVWSAGGSDLDRTRWLQPALFAIEYGLATLWRGWGITPAAMVGHSIGEWVAACVAGVFPFETGLDLVAARALAMDACAPGAMLAVACAPERLSPERLASLEATDPDLASEDPERASEDPDDASDRPLCALAADNAPERSVVAGPAAAIARIAASLAAEGTACRQLDTSHAFHTDAMAPAADALRRAFDGVELQAPAIPFASNVTGRPITAEQATDPTYWVRQMLSPVRFASGLEAMLAMGSSTRSVLLEVGPGRTLASLARQVISATPIDGHGARHDEGQGDGSATIVAPMARPGKDRAALLRGLGSLWSAGVAVDWPSVLERPVIGQRSTGRRARLPGYPFAGDRHWRSAPDAQSAALLAPPPVAAPDVLSRELAPASEPAASASSSAAAEVVIEVFSEALGRQPTSVEDDFFTLGGDSLMAVQVSEQLRRRLGPAVPEGVLLQASTVAEIAVLAGGAAREGELPPSVVTLRAGGLRTVDDSGLDDSGPLFLIHPVGGHVYLYRPLVRALGGERAVYGLRAPGLDDERPPIEGVEAMAEVYLSEMRTLQPKGPYRLAGSSFGGTVAYEIARRLTERGEAVALLALIDTAGPGQMPAELPDEAAVLIYLADSAPPDGGPPDDAPAGAASHHRASAHGFTAESLRALPAGERRARFLDFLRTRDPEMAAVSMPDFERFLTVFSCNTRAMWRYQHGGYPGHIVFFKAEERREGYDALHPELPWQTLAAGGMTVHRVAGNHISMLAPEHVEGLAALLGGYLEHPPGLLGAWPATTEPCRPIGSSVRSERSIVRRPA